MHIHVFTLCPTPDPHFCRGKFRSKPWQALLDEAKHLVDSGVVELNLIAEDTNQYGMDRKDGKGLAQVGGGEEDCGMGLGAVAEGTNQYGIDRRDGKGLAQVCGDQEGWGQEMMLWG